MKYFLAGAAALLFAGAANAQSLSVADLQAQIDAELSKGSEYAELLNNPDPLRARKAMELMLGSGDDVLIKAALDYGIFSPDKEVRNTAIKAFLDGSPRLELQIDGKRADEEALHTVLNRNYGLVPNGDGYAVTSIDVSGYDSKANCYMAVQYHKLFGSGEGRNCFLRIVGEVVQIRSTDRSWYEINFRDEGALQGTTLHEYNNTSAETTVTIPLR